MPAPGFPEWACVGAIVRTQADLRYRYVITRVEFRPAQMPEAQPGVYVISMGPVMPEQDPLPPRPAPIEPDDEFDLLTLITQFEWTGEWMDEDEGVVTAATTMPVTMVTDAIAPNRLLHIDGTFNSRLDGVYTIRTVEDTYGPPPNDRLVLTLERGNHLVEENVRPGLGTERPGYIHMLEDPQADLAVGTQFMQAAFEALVSTPAPGVDEPDVEMEPAAESMEGFEETTPDTIGEINPADFPNLRLVSGRRQTQSPPTPQTAQDEARRRLGPLATQAAVDILTLSLLYPAREMPDTDVPGVNAGQIWLLPQPNEGLWRVSVPSRPDGNITLTHIREQHRIMRSTPTWLIDHGVRQEPPDPRANRPGQQIIIGQIWDIPTGVSLRYTCPRWRVHEINERAGRIILMDAEGTAKRLYWTQAQLLRHGTYVGDGIPRRTSYERLLEDHDDD
jgi:hypothetical protein